MILLLRTSTENRSGASDSSSGAVGNCGPSGLTDLRRDQRAEHGDQIRRIAVDHAKHFDLSSVAGRVQLFDKGLDQLHRSGRPGDDQRIVAWIWRDAHFAEHPASDDFLPLFVHRQQFQHGRSPALAGLRRRNRLLQRLCHVEARAL